MQKLLSCTFLQVSDGLLCDAILEMGIDTAVADRLLALLAMACEGIVVKAAIIAVVVLDRNTVLQCYVLGGLLGSNGLCRGEIMHQKYLAEAGKMINKNGGSSVALNGKFSFHLGNESNLCGLNLVHWYTFAWRGGNKNLLDCICFHMPRSFCHGAE